MWIQTLQTLENLLSLTASEEVATFEIENIQNPLPTTAWRSTGLTPFIVGNFGDGAATPAEKSISVDTWGAWYTNARSGDQARLRLANSQAALTSTPLYDSGLVDIWPGSPSATYITNFLNNWSYTHQRATLTAQAATWFRIDFDYTGNPDGYVQVGSLPIGTRFTFAATSPYAQGFNRNTDPRAGFETLLAGGGLGRGGFTGKRPWSGTITITEAEWLDSVQPLMDSRLNGPVALVLEASEATRPLDYMYFGYPRAAVTPTRARPFLDLSITEP